MRILIIEDEPHLREQLQQYLQKQGFAVDVAEDGRSGLFMGREYPFDLAIVDLGLPELPGIDKPCVATCTDVLLERTRVGKRVIVVGGGMVGCETALWLAEQDREVTIVELLPKLISTRAAATSAKTMAGTRPIT